MIWKNKKVLATLILTVLLLLPNSTHAIDVGTIGLIPAHASANVFGSDIRFTYNLNLGETKEDGLRVINNGDQTIVVKLYPVDGTTTAEGSYSLMLEDSPRTDVGGWIHMAANEVEVGPHMEKTVPFTISIPANADAGDHLGGIIMEQIATDNTLIGTGLKVVTRVGIRVTETVPGPVVKDLSLTRFDYHYAGTGVSNFIKDLLDINRYTVFLVGVKNNGNVKLEPTATLDVKNIFGRSVVHLPDVPLGEVLPRGGENSDVEVVWKDLPFLGRYVATITVDPVKEGMVPQTQQIVIWAFPYKIAFLLVLLGIIIMLIRLFKIYFAEASKEKYPIYTVKMGDNLADLAEKFFVDWKKIANINYIGKPYEIKAGEKLFIPQTKKNRRTVQKLRESGELTPSIFERAGKTGFGKKRAIFIGVVLLLAAGGAAWGIKLRRDQLIHQIVQVPPAPAPQVQETSSKTKSGALKKSGVSVNIITLASGDPESSSRLQTKFNLEGYKVNMAGTSNKYATTTVEYNSGKEEEAKMVQTDLGADDQADLSKIELKQVNNPGADVVVYNALSKDNFLPADVYNQPQ